MTSRTYKHEGLHPGEELGREEHAKREHHVIEEPIMGARETGAHMEHEIGERIGKTGSAFKEGVVDSLKGSNEIETETMNLVRDTLVNTLQATVTVASEGLNLTRDVLRGTISATEEVGTGAIEAAGMIGTTAIRVVKEVMVGVLGGVKEIAGAALPERRPAASEPHQHTAG